MDKKNNFTCDKCGICCRNLNENEIYNFLDRGDGVCKNLDEKSNLCTVYEERPLICNVIKAYQEIYSNYIPYEEYKTLNKDGCKILKYNNLKKIIKN